MSKKQKHGCDATIMERGCGDMKKQTSMKKSRRLPRIIFLLAVLMMIMIPFAAFAEEFSCTVTLPVKVQIDGKNPPALDYKFKIEAESNAPLPEVTEVTVNASESGTVEFGPIIYNRPGNYYYRITQLTDNRINLTYDSRTYAVTVQILRSEDNTLHAEIVASTGNTDGSKAGEIVFVNKYSRPSSGGSDDDWEPDPKPSKQPTETDAPKPTEPQTDSGNNTPKDSPTPDHASATVSPADGDGHKITPPDPRFPYGNTVADAQNSRKLSSGNPQTGDTTHRVLWTVLGVGSGLMLLVLFVLKRRSDEEERS